ncbi:hypothetical protein NQ315_007890 [Exocentrus adspersus]|uniref:DUF4817 domain-containing protein n=1 Tax=Exocentrus adspersus TaxID=1586481 RepID=A0AAV8W861_9CUCU|nr:hypothetical protein NQ315_007890 [Exocentrus adspersus]
MIFTNEEYADIHFCYGFCDGNAEAAVREYRRRYPNRRLPSAQVFSRTHQNFRNFGLGGNVDHNRNRQNNNNQNRILRAFDNNPRLSSRRAAHQLQISKSQILRTLRNNHKHAYHLQPVHHLHPGDPEQRKCCANNNYSFRDSTDSPDEWISTPHRAFSKFSTNLEFSENILLFLISGL